MVAPPQQQNLLWRRGYSVVGGELETRRATRAGEAGAEAGVGAGAAAGRLGGRVI